MARKAFANEINTKFIDLKNKKSIKAKTTATPAPNFIKSSFIKDIISTAIIEGPPR